MSARHAKIVAPYWNHYVHALERHGSAELRTQQEALQEQLERDYRLIEALRMEAARLRRLRQIYFIEAKVHLLATRVADSVVLDQTPFPNAGWVWRQYSASTLILECDTYDDIWISLDHPYAFSKAYPKDRWIDLIIRTYKAQSILTPKITNKHDEIEFIIFRIELINYIVERYYMDGKVGEISTEDSKAPASGSEKLNLRQIEFLNTGLDVLNEAEPDASRKTIIDSIALALQSKAASRAGGDDGLTWSESTVKRVAISLGIYRERNGEKTRAPREVERANEEAFKAELRQQAERLRQEGVNTGKEAGEKAV